ncbi:MAG: right-handed parallel beta-helix repeat-containing protein [Pseudomonadota bacterium]
MRSTITAVLLAVTLALPVSANEYYVDPVDGAAGNDGSAATPWKSVQDVVRSGRLAPGDVVRLRSGYHGALLITGHHNAGAITIKADDGHEPRLRQVRISDSSRWILSGLAISPSHARTALFTPIVEIDATSRDIVLSDSRIESVADSAGRTAEEWRLGTAHAVLSFGEAIEIRGNTIRNIRHGVGVTGPRAIVENNLIEDFIGDGIRVLGDHSEIRGNTIRNCYVVDDNHDDGIQSWSLDAEGRAGRGEVVGVVLSGNTIINHEDPAHPLRCNLQGIGLFDGIFVDWVIENNVVVVEHGHGITVMGARNVRAVNNTVVDLVPEGPWQPWVTITAHKDGRLPEDSLIANNLAHSYNLEKGFDAAGFVTGPTGVALRDNMEIDDPDRFFVDAAAFDFRLRESSPAIGAGNAADAPAVDRSGAPRSTGGAVDLGAYERQ